jgi:glutamine synthetase
VHPDTSTLHDLGWRPGWRICLGTPNWPDGSRCEIATREVLRGALGQVREAGYEAMAAIKYELRLRDGQDRLVTTGISYSAGGRRARRLRERAAPALEDLGVELTAVHRRPRPGCSS